MMSGLSKRVCVATLAAAAAAGAQETQRLVVPDPDIGAGTLATRRAAQLRAAAEIGVFHDFAFADRIVDSGIDFVHQAVDDGGKTYKAAHYDHGNGLAVADVDGDGLLDLYFVNQLGGNGLFRNLGGGRFANVTAAAGVGLDDRICVSASFADVDNDGDSDLFVTTVRMGNVLFQNDGAGNFDDVTDRSGLGYTGHSSGAVFFDYDRDGLLDLYVANVGEYTTDERGRGGFYVAHEDAFSGHLTADRAESSVLYRNLGNSRFADVTVAAGVLDDAWSGDAIVVDPNADGFPDLYVLNMQGNDRYYENRQGTGFVERTAEVFSKTPWGTMGVNSFDYDNDGDFDLLLTDMHSDMSAEVGPAAEHLKPRIDNPEQFYAEPDDNLLGNAFYRRSDGSFDEISDTIGLENYWPWGTSVGDINADGWQDVFIGSSMNYPFRYGINALKLNDAARRFVDAEFVLGIEPRRDGQAHTAWFDLDCSGADSAHHRCEGLSGPVAVFGALGTRSAAIIDVDDDGDLDIVTNEFGSRPQLLLSDLSERREVHWLALRLQSESSNRDGIGARLTVRAGDRTYTRFIDGKSGYMTQSSVPAYFGLDDATSVDEIRVVWPNGNEQVIDGPIDIDRSLVVTEE